MGINIDMDELRSARSAHPEAVSARVCLVAAAGEATPVVIELFNLAVFGWSL